MAFWTWAEGHPYLTVGVVVTILWGAYNLLVRVVALLHRQACPGCGRRIIGLPGPIVRMVVPTVAEDDDTPPLEDDDEGASEEDADASKDRPEAKLEERE